jgi:hypothetical protein
MCIVTIREMYIEAMGKTLRNVFKNYYAQLFKLELVYATRNDLIAVEDAALRSMFSNKVIITSTMHLIILIIQCIDLIMYILLGKFE